MFYLLIYLMEGSLPWEMQEHSFKDIRIMKMVCFSTIEDQNLPGKEHSLIIKAALMDFALHIKGLGFSQKPDYDYLRECLQRLIPKDSHSPDWISIPLKEDFRTILIKQWL